MLYPHNFSFIHIYTISYNTKGNREIKQEMDRCKDHSNLLQCDKVVDDEIVKLIAPDCNSMQKSAMLKLNNPVQTLQKMYVYCCGYMLCMFIVVVICYVCLLL